MITFFIYLLHETWLSTTFAKFVLGNLCKIIEYVAMTTMLSGPSTTKEIWKKISFCVNYFFVLGMRDHDRGRNIFRLIVLVFINHYCYSNHFNRNHGLWISSKTVGDSKNNFFGLKFALDWSIYVPVFINNSYLVLQINKRGERDVRFYGAPTLPVSCSTNI